MTPTHARFIRKFLRKNAESLAAQLAPSFLAHGRNGYFARAESEVALNILERTLVRHLKFGGKPTMVPLTMEQARKFPIFKGEDWATRRAWLVVVSDSDGQLAYGLAQEGHPAIDPKIREMVARARAQRIACDSLLRMTSGHEVPHGNA